MRSISMTMLLVALLAASPSARGTDQDHSAQFAPMGSHQAAFGSGSGFGGDKVSALGHYSAQLPISLPSPRGDLPIPFSVSYTGSNRMGAAGLGWDIGYSYVLRSKTESRRKPLFTSASPTVSATRILLSMQGRMQLMNPTGSASAYRALASDSFGELRGPFLFGGDPEGAWYFFDASNREYRFVKRTSQWDLGDPDVWMLDRIRDTSNNYVELKYTTQDLFGGKELRLVELGYSHSLGCPTHRVTFEYGRHDGTNIAPTLLRHELDRTRVRVQTAVLTSVTIKTGCAQQQIAKYELIYVDDRDSQRPYVRLRWLDLIGSDGTTRRRLREFDYEHASDTEVDAFVFEPTGIMAPEVSDDSHFGASHEIETMDPPPWPWPGVPTFQRSFDTTRMLADFTGDGLPDFVFGDPSEPAGAPMMLRNIAGYFSQPAEPLFPPGSPDARTLQSQTVRSVTYTSCQGAQSTIITETWRALIDWNGDGRMDLVDAKAGADPGGDPSNDYWQVLVNVPDPNGGHYWHVLNVDIRELRTRLAGIHNCALPDIESGACAPNDFDDGGPLPISRAKNGGKIRVDAMWIADDQGNVDDCDTFTFPDHVPCSDDNHEDCFGPRLEDTISFAHTEWKLQDLNGDGFPDFVFNDQPLRAGWDDRCEYLEDPEINQAGCDENPIQCWGRYSDLQEDCCEGSPVIWECGSIWEIRLPLENNVRVSYNKNGGHLASQTPIEFTSATNARIIQEGDICGVEMWRSDGGSPLVKLMCGFREVNGDALVDRISNAFPLELTGSALISDAKLNLGVGFHGPIVSLPGIADVKESQHDTVCGRRNDPHHLDDETPYDEVTRSSLVDITGDGIPDFVFRSGAGWKVSVGSGVGFVPAEAAFPIEISELSFALSHERHQCDGKRSTTIAGLVDFDGDGHPDVINSAGHDLMLAQLRNRSDDRALNSGRLISIKNDDGLRSDIRYGSAKTQDTSSKHQVPHPEIVVFEVSHVPTKEIGTPTDSIFYAYGEIGMRYQPLLARWISTGYTRRVIMQADSLDPVPHGIARIEELLRPEDLPPGIANYALTGRTHHTTLISGVDVNVLAWLAATPDFGSAREGGGEKRWNFVNMGAGTTTTEAECNDVDAYLFDSAASSSTWGAYLCRAAAVVVNVYDEAWRGSEPPPARSSSRTDYIERLTEVITFDEYGRPTKVQFHNDTAFPEDNYCIEHTWASGPSSSSLGVMNAPATTRVTDCDRTAYAGARNYYDGLLVLGQVGAGLKTRVRFENYDTTTGASFGHFLASTMTYTPTGRLHSITRHRTGGVTNTRTITYDAFDLNPEHLVDHASDVATDPVRTFSFDPVTLELESATDVNGEVVTLTRDAFGRPLLTYFLNPSSGVDYVIGDSQYFDGSFDGTERKSTQHRRFDDWVPASTYSSSAPPPTGVTQYTAYFDEYGRVLQVQDELGADYPGQTLITNYLLYDVHGRLRFAADPFLSSENESEVYGTSFHYDRASRLRCTVRGPGYQEETTALASEDRYPTCYTYAYESRQTVVRKQGPNELGATAGSAELGAYDESRVSATGRLLAKSRFSETGVRLEHSTFIYDRVGNLIENRRSIDPLGAPVVSWVTHFDSLGRVLSVEEPATATRNMSYDEWGDLLSTTWTSAGVTRGASYEYDGFGRLTESAPILAAGDPPLPTYNYYYDVSSGDPVRQPTPSNLIGRLSWATDGRISTYLSYDVLGSANRAFHWDSTDALLFREHYAHRPSGALSALTFEMPDAAAPEIATYLYDSAGRLEQINWSDVSGPASRPLFQATNIDPFGRYLDVEYGNTVKQRWTYRADRRRELQERLLTSTLGARLVEFESYDGEGRVLVRRESFGASPSKETIYTYDQLERLGRALETTGTTITLDETFSYDALGNLRMLTDAVRSANSRWFSPEPLDPDRACRIADTPPPPFFPPCNYSYDPLGNVVAAPDADGITRSFTYDPSSRITEIRKGAARATFRWGALGQVNVIDVAGAGLSNRAERNYGPLVQRARYGTWRIERRIPGPGGIVAMRRGTGPTAEVLYPHADETALQNVTGGAGGETEAISYRPFGGIVNDTAIEGSIQEVNRKWNGGELFKAFGVSQLGARLYDAPTGRFLSRDPIFQVGAAAFVNPYAFAGNDPINLADPTGLQVQDQPTDGQNFVELDMGESRMTTFDDGFDGPVYAVEQGGEVPASELHAGGSGPFSELTSVYLGPQPETGDGWDEDPGSSLRIDLSPLQMNGSAIAIAGVLNTPSSIYANSYKTVAAVDRMRRCQSNMCRLEQHQKAQTHSTLVVLETASTVIPAVQGGRAVRAGVTAVQTVKVATSTGKASSAVLGRNLLRLFKTRPAETAAHHIVAGEAKLAEAARAVLRRFGIDINDARNGVFLPVNKKSANPTGAAVHSQVHGPKYYAKVNRLMNEATSREEVFEILDIIRQQLLKNNF
jgi:RHS repeat-associated protein